MGKVAVCEGEVVKVEGKRSSIDWYEEEFVLDDSVAGADQARCMLQAGLVAERLRGKVAGFRRVRTCQVVSFEKSDRKSELGEVGALLIRATELGCIPEGYERYASDKSRCKALATAIERAEERRGAAEEPEVKTRRGRPVKVTGGEYVDA